MMGIVLSLLAFAALFAGFGLLNRGREGQGGGCGCGDSCHHFSELESELRSLHGKDGVER